MIEQKISVCPLDCPDACSLVMDVENGRVIKVSGNKNHPITQGSICNKTRNMHELIHHKERILHPMKRVGKKGEGLFEQITWEEAYSTIIDNFKDTIDKFGAEAIIPYSFYGNMGALNSNGMDRRFFHKLGATVLDRSICHIAGNKGFSVTMGATGGIEPEEISESKYIIVWGGNIVSTNMHATMPMTEARKKGAKIIAIDVQENKTGKWADEFICIRPGTDGALAMGVIHLLIKNNHIDTDFVEKYTVGFEQLKLSADEYTPSKTSELTGIPIDVIEKLAFEYGTASPSFIRIGNGLQHHENGAMIVRTISCLPSLTGQWTKLGGGAIKSNGYYSDFNWDGLTRPDLLENPNTREINMNQIGRALHDLEKPIKTIFIYNSNIVQVAPNASMVRSGLLRDDIFTVVHEIQMTDTAKYADILLPATTSFENLDIFASYWHQYVMISEPVIDIQGEAISNHNLYKELARRMGFDDDCFLESEEDTIRIALDSEVNPYFTGITYEGLKEHKFLRMTVNKEDIYINPKTPTGKIEFYSPTMEEFGQVPKHVPLSDNKYPFRFVPAPNHSFLNTTYGNVEKLRKIEKHPVVSMNTIDAEKYGIIDGDNVILFNDRGECRLNVSVGNEVLPGVLVSNGLWWEDKANGYSTVNVLTPDTLSDLGGGASFFSGTVDVRKISV